MTRTRAMGTAWASVVAGALAACGGGSSRAGAYALQARAGTYDDGSGRLGLAVLATVRDASGAGPAAPSSASIADGAGTLAAAQYAGPGPGSYAAWWWPEIAVRTGEPYVLTVGDGPDALRVSLPGPAAGGVPVAVPVVAADASRIDWPAVPGAASYACRVYAGGALQLDAVSRAPGCDLSALPPGGYEASILAFGADLVELAASASPAPALPARFDVSEARLGLARPSPGGAGLRLLAAGGAFDFGTSQRGLAAWVSISNTDGTPTSQAWTVSIVGPGLPASAPATFDYFAYLPRQMSWSYDVPATPGTYAITATSGATALSTTVSVGFPPSLPFVLDAAATPGVQGSADVTWTPVQGARAYLVDVWDAALGQRAQSMWVPAPPAQFPHGSFVAGGTYRVYVAATDADMSGATTPTQVSVSEYPYLFATFVE